MRRYIVKSWGGGFRRLGAANIIDTTSGQCVESFNSVRHGARFAELALRRADELETTPKPKERNP